MNQSPFISQAARIPKGTIHQWWRLSSSQANTVMCFQEECTKIMWNTTHPHPQTYKQSLVMVSCTAACFWSSLILCSIACVCSLQVLWVFFRLDPKNMNGGKGNKTTQEKHSCKMKGPVSAWETWKWNRHPWKESKIKWRFLAVPISTIEHLQSSVANLLNFTIRIFTKFIKCIAQNCNNASIATFVTKSKRG